MVLRNPKTRPAFQDEADDEMVYVSTIGDGDGGSGVGGEGMRGGGITVKRLSFIVFVGRL